MEQSHLDIDKREHLCDVTYLHQHQIITDIKMSFDIEYSIPGINKWLHKNRFSYKKPKGVPHKFDEEKQAKFIEYYNVLKAALTNEQPLLLSMQFIQHKRQKSQQVG
jgi:hypothetical protein